MKVKVFFNFIFSFYRGGVGRERLSFLKKFFFKSSPEDMFIDFREKRSDSETLLWERNISSLPPVLGPTGDHTLGMCPGWESHPQPFGVWNNAPTNWATWPGPDARLFNMTYITLWDCYFLTLFPATYCLPLGSCNTKKHLISSLPHILIFCLQIPLIGYILQFLGDHYSLASR